jgi:CRP/FNR family transcriptional regulator, cyclic AMP receptor protein
MTLKRSVRIQTNSGQPVLKVTARALLGRAMGFRDCLPATLDALVAAGEVRTLGKGETLVRRGEPFDRLCLLIQGSLEVSLLRHDGHRHLISFLQPGDLAGLISLLDGMGHVNNMAARGAQTALLLVPGDAVRSWRAQDPMLGRAIELQLAFRTRLLYERFAADASVPVASRLAGLLRTLAGLYGSEGPEGIRLDIKISQSDLADWLGVTRQRINAAIQKLQQDGLIRLSYSRITIVDPGSLAELARL